MIGNTCIELLLGSTVVWLMFMYSVLTVSAYACVGSSAKALVTMRESSLIINLNYFNFTKLSVLEIVMGF